MILDIDPTVDYAFKYVFGRESTAPILVDLLDGVLDPPPEHRILDVDLLNPFRLTEQTHAFPLAEEIEFHIIQLPRFTKTAAELTSRLDFWLYFLRHAAKIDTEAIPAALQQPLLLRAVEELKVLTQNDIERERYEARRKGQLDHDTGLRAARLEGEAKARNALVDTIQLFEQLLHRPESPAEQLANLTLEELGRLAKELQSQLKMTAPRTGSGP